MKHLLNTTLLVILLSMIYPTAKAQVEIVSTGSVNAYEVSYPANITAYTNGMTITFKAHMSNTTASSINVNGLGVRNILNTSLGSISANDIKQDQIVTVTYDGTNFQMTTSTGNVVSGPAVGIADAPSNGYIPKWNGNSLENSVLFSTGTAVGIGTTAPSGTMEIEDATSTITLDHTTTSNFSAVIFAEGNTADGYIGQQGSTNNREIELTNYSISTNSGISFKTSNTGTSTKLRISNDGNVGIGTTNPVKKLFVESASSDAIWLRGNTGGYTSYLASYIVAESNIDGRGRGLFLPSVAAEASASWFAGVPYTGGGFQIGNSSTHTTENAAGPYILANAKLFIKNDGNVGIGTTLPTQKLDIMGNVNISGNYKIDGIDALYGNGVSTYGNIRVLQNLSTVSQDGMYINYNSTGTTAAHLRFYANGTSERMRIDAFSGNVGIGTTAPQATLDVNGSMVVGYREYAGSTSVSNSDYILVKIGSSGGTITLPPPTLAGRILIIRNQSSGGTSVSPTFFRKNVSGTSSTISNDQTVNLFYSTNSAAPCSGGCWVEF